MKNVLLYNGEIIQDLEVAVFYPRRRAPFRKFAIVNLDADLAVSKLSGLDAKILLQLVFCAKPMGLKDLAQLVGTPTSCASRSLKRLVELKKVEKLGRGTYQASRKIVHYGRWKDSE
jgi:predicted transcriptional regulator